MALLVLSKHYVNPRLFLIDGVSSPIYSFGITINNVLNQINILLDKIDRGDDYIDESLDIRDVDLEDEELEDKLIGNKVKVLLQDIDLVKWKQDLDYDKRLLEQLLKEAKAISASRDAKLDELKKLITNKINNPINGTNKKILIFSAFADTANYLYNNLAAWIKNEFGLYSALVTGSGTNKATLPISSVRRMRKALKAFFLREEQRSSIIIIRAKMTLS